MALDCPNMARMVWRQRGTSTMIFFCITIPVLTWFAATISP